MPDVLVRDVDGAVLERLKASAKAHGRSLQAELHEILRASTVRSLAETQRLSTRWLKRLRRGGHSDSAVLIRDDRDTR
jgi:plasmid stability protein